MNGDRSHTSGYQFQIGDVNVASFWNPTSDNHKDFGGFYFSTEEKVLRWIHRGDTLYDVELPEDAEWVEVNHENDHNGVFITNKIIVTNPRKITDELVIELYKKSSFSEKKYYQCLVTLLYRKYFGAVKYIIKDRINENNINEAIDEFERYISKDTDEFNYDNLWDDAKEIYDILKEIQDELHISLYVDKEPYRKVLSDEKVINLTGESGSGKSYFSNQWKDDKKYIIVDTDIVFSDTESDNMESVELRKLFQNKSKDYLIHNFDNFYKEVLDYFKDSNKILVIDSAQYRNIKDVSILKGEIIIMRTSIDKCYERCIDRWKDKNNYNYSNEELEKYKDKKLGIYKWYKSINILIDHVDLL